MSIYTEIRNEYGIDPRRIYLEFDIILAEKPADWNLPAIDVLDIWGDMSLRAAVALLTGGDTPTTYSKRMAEMIRIITDPEPTLLGMDEEPVEADYTRALETIRSLRRDAVDAEVVDD
jgi:hypothetical protein